MQLLVELALELVESAQAQSGFSYALQRLPETHPFVRTFGFESCYEGRPLPDIAVSLTNTIRLQAPPGTPAAHFAIGVEGCEKLMGAAADALTKGQRQHLRHLVAMAGICDAETWGYGGDAFLTALMRDLDAAMPTWCRTEAPVVLEACRAIILRLAEGRLTPGQLQRVRDSGAPALVYLARKAREGDLEQALALYSRAATLARAAGDKPTLVRAILGTGNVLLRQGDEGAEGLFLDAADEARAARLPELEGEAYHDLLALAIHRGRHRAVEQYARKARKAFRRSPDHLLRLASDVAYWMIERKHYGSAIPIFAALRRSPRTEAFRLQVLCAYARALAGAGMREAFAGVAAEATELDDVQTYLGAGDALLDLAEGAVMLGEWDAALRYAESAMRLGKRRGAFQVVANATDIAGKIKRREGAALVGPAGPSLWSPCENLSEELVAALSTLAA
ncbi:MAG: hypothetical protein AB1941_15645 [Gemmatimonadota bacterium]